ncbi:MAG TPA: [FeFe] hydrogenase H-cluster radical SAM maturase HydE, partial [Clostridiales bacterium]|nr:[FeFe] hydrogenase H-cluster radical SAM maturase HydE [Clostridiales bacterium]
MLKLLIDKLEKENRLTKEEFAILIDNATEEVRQYLFSKARKIKERYFGNKIYIRGLIEFTNYCKNDCYYCGIRRSN